MPNCRLKRLLTVVLIIAWVCAGKPASAAAPPEISARAAILIEWQTGTVLMEKRGFVRMHPASLTKMMTALVALERGRLEDLVRVSEEAASQPGSSMHLRPGDVFTLEDLLYGLMLVSGNDAAWAIAEHIGKGLASEFFELMNRRAKELGAINTRFENPHGLTHPNHYTTAFDLAVIAKACMRHPFFKQLVATKEKDAIEAESGVLLSLENTNRLLWIVPGADGVKTGTTQAAGQCLVASATRDGMRLLSVVLDSADRWHDTAALLEYGFDNFRYVKALSAGDVILTLPVSRSRARRVPILCAAELSACMPRYDVGLRIEVDLPDSIDPCPGGTAVGQASLRLGDQVVGSCDLVTGAWIGPRTPLRILVCLAYKALASLFSFGLL